MYSNDTFFNLTMPGQIGLALLSVILCAFTVWLFLKISTRFALWVKLLLSIVVLWFFVWLSPQIYYTYYWMIFDNLPVQIVIRWPPNLAEVFELMTFTGSNNLSAHSKGALFWIMVITAFWASRGK
ncbi:MAG: hypothetical protein AAGA53_00185 [Pseudomonadota bacterium]